MTEDKCIAYKIRWIGRYEQFVYRYNLLVPKMQNMIKQIDDDVPLNDFQVKFFQDFRKSYEFGWKMLKDYLKYNGHVLYLPREVVQKSYEIGIIPDENIWLNLISDITIYNELPLKDIKNALFYRINNYYLPEFTRFKEYLESRIKEYE